MSPATASVPATLSPRLSTLRDTVMAAHGSWPRRQHPYLTDVALWRAAVAGRSFVQQRAAFLRELVDLAPIELDGPWHLAGKHLAGQRFMSLREPLPAPLATMTELGVPPDQTDAVRAAVAAWQQASAPRFPAPPYTEIGACPDDLRLGLGGWGCTESTMVFWAGGWIENHSIRDYAKVLRVGYAGLRREIEALQASADIADPDYVRKDSFWQAARFVCAAGELLGARHAAAAREQARIATDRTERARLELIAATCERVPAEGARNFFEAVQSLWLAHVLTCGEDGINANSLGRLDQVLWPWYEADRRAGRLSREEALDILVELGLKLYLDYDVQAITLGGVTPDGRDAVNELSELFLEATARAGVIRDLSVRLNAGTPAPFLKHAARLIAEGGGIPFLFNDDCFIPALTERGIDLADARDYAPIGCIELTIPGRANPHAVSGWFNAAKCLELALFDGCDPASGTRVGPPTGMLTDHPSFASLLAAYRHQVDVLARRMVFHVNRGELAQRERGPLPCWSLLTDACIERGRDITDGGAIYNYHSICFLGTANAADSLMALRRLVFEEGRVDADELLSALRANFAGHEPLRQLLLKGAPKYGNDQADVDDLAATIANHFIDLMDTMRSPLGGRYVVHLFSFLCNLNFGKTVGATPDGRLAGEPLAYSLSAHQGRDVRGVTAMLNSLARLPHARAAGASAAIVELDPKVVGGEAGIQRLVQLIRGAMAMGVGQLQWNIVTAERLRQAQADPERHGNLPVRVAGFSQMFKLVSPELQEHIIARTKHTE